MLWVFEKIGDRWVLKLRWFVGKRIDVAEKIPRSMVGKQMKEKKKLGEEEQVASFSTCKIKGIFVIWFIF